MMKKVALQKYEYLTSIAGIAISIPIIFFITLLILKKIRKLLIGDLDKKALGIFLDKLFGIIYGIVFSYIIITAAISFIFTLIFLISISV